MTTSNRDYGKKASTGLNSVASTGYKKPTTTHFANGGGIGDRLLEKLHPTGGEAPDTSNFSNEGRSGRSVFVDTPAEDNSDPGDRESARSYKPVAGMDERDARDAEREASTYKQPDTAPEKKATPAKSMKKPVSTSTGTRITLPSTGAGAGRGRAAWVAPPKPVSVAAPAKAGDAAKLANTGMDGKSLVDKGAVDPKTLLPKKLANGGIVGKAGGKEVKPKAFRNGGKVGKC